VDRLFFPQKVRLAQRHRVTQCLGVSRTAHLFFELKSVIEQELTYIRFVLQNVGIVAVAYGIAVALPVFSTLLGIFGAVTSTIIAYILPTFFYMRTSQRSFLNDRFSWVALALLILGGSAGLVRKHHLPCVFYTGSGFLVLFSLRSH
jgi:hypothetical protein